MGGATSSYVYDSDGLRTQKTVGSVVYDYYWDNGKLSAMTITNGSNITTMMFAYDSEGTPFAMSYNGTVYYYCTDVQGNVLGIFNEYGLCAYYEYDAWGNILDQNAAGSTDYNAIMANSLRYRGYIYDTETEMYYLQSRYYDPAIGRFLNADDVSYIGASKTLLSTNLFAYCENDAVNMVDPSGNLTEGIIIGGVVVATVVVIGITFVCLKYNSFKKNPTIVYPSNRHSALDDFIKLHKAMMGTRSLLWGLTKSWLDRKLDELKADLEKRFEKGKKEYKHSTERHHLVAKKSVYATKAAKILWEIFPKDGPENSANILVIKTGLHKRLHTHLYYGITNTIVVSAYRKANGDKNQQKENVKKALKTIKDFVNDLNRWAPC